MLGVAALNGFAMPPTGDLFVMLNASSYSLYVVFAKGSIARYGTLTVMAWVFGAGAVLFAPFGGVALAREAIHWPNETRLLVAFIVLVPTALAYAMNAWALGRATPTLVTIYIYFQPIVVAVLAWAQLGDPLHGRTIAAGLAILVGVAIVATAPRKTALETGSNA